MFYLFFHWVYFHLIACCSFLFINMLFGLVILRWYIFDSIWCFIHVSSYILGYGWCLYGNWDGFFLDDLWFFRTTCSTWRVRLLFITVWFSPFLASLCNRRRNLIELKFVLVFYSRREELECLWVSSFCSFWFHRWSLLELSCFSDVFSYEIDVFVWCLRCISEIYFLLSHCISLYYLHLWTLICLF